jgi:uncharacterized membrane protein YeaQ/YmgE (transglycosylase-associated protein family)
MRIIAWIVLGLSAGLLANMLIPDRRSQGLAEERSVYRDRLPL